MPSSTRRFPAPWSAELQPNYYVVRDANGQQIAYIYYSNEPDRRAAAKLLTKDEARRIAQRREADAYGSNCNVKLTALHRLKPSSNAKSHEGSITTVASLQAMGPLTCAQNEVR